MEISLLQAFALGIIAFIAGLDMFNGLTHMHRPVVLGPLVGLVLGDLHTGILTGGTLELVWMGLAPLAGAQPPNVIIGTIVGTAFAITTGVKPRCRGRCRRTFRCRSTDGDYLPVLGDVWRDVSLRPDGGERRYSRH